MFGKASSILILFFITTLPALSSGSDLQIPDTLQSADTLSFVVRAPDRQFLNQYRENKDFDYAGEFRKSGNQDIFARILRKIYNLWKRGISAFMSLHVVLRVALLVLAGAIILYLIFRSKLYRLFYTDGTIREIDYSEHDPMNDAVNLEEALRTLVENRKYRSAVRLLYIKTLSILQRNGLVILSGEKTNRDYSREIKDRETRESFQELASIYNLVWYGNHELDESGYGQVSPRFNNFFNKVNGKNE